jgi:glycosyltransferase involved in cell wall biosynthesis
VPDGQLIKGLDWFVTSDWTEPKLHVKKATIVHDLVFKKYPKTVQKQILHTQEKRLKWVTKESNVIFCDSMQTAADLKEAYHIEDQRLVVNYPGVEITKIESSADVLKKYGISSNFILTVGKQEPRKNYTRLIDAYQKLEIANKPELLIIGIKGWGSKEKNVKGVHYLGFVEDSELAELYSKALFFVFPSLYEGFGYPLVEAMMYGCSTTVSATSSLAEIGGDATLMFDPKDTNSIEQALAQMITDESLRAQLSVKGYNLASSFTWKRYYDTFISTLTQRV